MQLPCTNIHTDQPTQQALFPDCFEVSVAPVKGKKVVLDFQGGNTTSDAGVLLLKEVESMTGIISTLAHYITDSRRSTSVMHSIHDLIAQRVYQIACGYEDGNDSNSMRKDPALKMALNRLPESGDDLASQPTFSRLENMVIPILIQKCYNILKIKRRSIWHDQQLARRCSLRQKKH